MERLADTLNSLTPLVIIVSMTLFLTLESWFPYFQHGTGRRKQRWRNLGMVAISMVVNVAITGAILAPIAWSEANRFGLLYRLSEPSLLTLVIGVFLVDLCSYTLHVTMHKVPALWRVHRVHHADIELDASSAIRLHPLELIFLLTMLTVALSLLGVSMGSYALYTTLALPWFLFNHCNVRFPGWFERYGSLLMSTPNWHRVHHSSYQPETDSHYGCVFSVWDRLFGTTRKTQVENLRFGLERFRQPVDQTVGGLLKMPFKEL
jgi:sterol desaturase/sphingolipid hydroxylase (fatty acid hydroxylase superfamily)